MEQQGQSLQERLLLIQQAIGTLPKTNENTFHHYKYVTEAQVKDKLNGLLAQHQIVILPQVKSSNTTAMQGKDWL